MKTKFYSSKSRTVELRFLNRAFRLYYSIPSIPTVLAFSVMMWVAMTSCKADEEGTELPYMDVPSEAAFPLLSTAVDADILDGIVKATLTQVYVNRGESTIEAVYTFPLSTHAAVHGMQMKIGERLIEAKIEKKEEAHAIYEEAKAQQKSASLLEQKRPNVFQTKVANILPGERVEVTVYFSELLTPEDLVYEWVFPTVVGPRYSAASREPSYGDANWLQSPYFKADNEVEREEVTTFTLSAEIQSSVPFQGLQCTSHRPQMEYDSSKCVKITLDSSVPGFQANRDFILKYKLADDEIISGLVTHTGNEENFFLLNVQPPSRVTPEHIPNREYIFVVDVSGSMTGFPLDVTKELFTDLSKNLRESDKFNVLFFAGASKLLSKESLPANQHNLKRALQMMNNHRGGGGTELKRALSKAFKIHSGEDLSRNLVVITDGFISAESDTFELIRQSRGSANVFCFGIGSSVNRHLIEGVAKVGGGEPFIVTRPSEASEVATRFREYISSPVLTNIQVSGEGVDLFDVQPSSVNDLFANRALVISGKWKATTDAKIHLSGVTGDGEPYKQSYEVKKGEAAQNPVLEDLWARQTVKELVDFQKVAPGSDLEHQITNLGLKYSLLTPFTSFVAVDHEVKNTGAHSESVKQPLPLPAGVTKSAVSSGQVISNGSIPEPSAVLLLFLSALTALTVRRR